MGIQTKASATLRNPAMTFLLGCLLAAVCFGLLGCGGMKDLNVRPEGCEQSVIYDTLPAPMVAGAVLLVTTNELTLHKPQAKPFLLGAIGRVLSALEDDEVTYLEVGRMVTDNAKWINDYFGSRLVAYGTLLEVFDRPVPISPCDRDLIRRHLEKQKAMLEA